MPGPLKDDELLASVLNKASPRRRQEMERFWKNLTYAQVRDQFRKNHGIRFIDRLLEIVETGRIRVRYHEMDKETGREKKVNGLPVVREEAIKVSDKSIIQCLLRGVEITVGGYERGPDIKGGGRGRLIDGKEGAKTPLDDLRAEMEEATSVLDEESGEGPEEAVGGGSDGGEERGSVLQPDGLDVRPEAGETGGEAHDPLPVSVETPEGD